MPGGPSIYSLIDERFGVMTRSQINQYIETIGTSAAMIARADAQRVAMSVMNLAGSGRIWVLPNRDVSTTRGFVLTPNGSFTTDMAFDFTLPAQEWWAIGENADMAIMVHEILAQEP